MALPPLRFLSACFVALLAALALIAQLGQAIPHAAAGSSCDASASLDGEEARFFSLINDYRQQHGLSQLILSSALSRSAAWKAQNMADNNYFAHDDTPIGRRWLDRIRACGYAANTFIGENIAAGDSTAAGALNIWRTSPGHNAQMLNDTYHAIGVGRAYNRGSDSGWYWVTDFGGVADTTISGGDVDCDGKIDSVDATLILQASAGMVSSLRCAAQADVDRSGTVDAADALLVLQYVAGLVG